MMERMYVNPFWFGFLMALVVIVVLSVIAAIIKNHTGDDEEIELTEEEYQKILEEMTGKAFRITRRNGYLVGEPIEDKDDEENSKKSQ